MSHRSVVGRTERGGLPLNSAGEAMFFQGLSDMFEVTRVVRYQCSDWLGWEDHVAQMSG